MRKPRKSYGQTLLKHYSINTEDYKYNNKVRIEDFRVRYMTNFPFLIVRSSFNE